MEQEHPEPGPAGEREVRTVFAGLMLALALASLDQNIVGIALPQIVSELGGLSQLSWVVTSFLVASTATTPLYGKLSDMYGRKPLFIGAGHGRGIAAEGVRGPVRLLLGLPAVPEHLRR